MCFSLGLIGSCLQLLDALVESPDELFSISRSSLEVLIENVACEHILLNQRELSSVCSPGDHSVLQFDLRNDDQWYKLAYLVVLNALNDLAC